MSDIKLVTNRDLQGKNPLYPSSGLMHEFVLLNMGPGEGIWLVDRYYPLFDACKNAAMDVAAMFGDKDTLEKLVAIQPLTVAES